ncbi:Retrovirus-related Pol polyprotein like [Argiope bruennichi]|uniref:Retrovirus-related Pol polyprotein like n=1 Tax=Argiope bruennichi TaxID=94029 RepID=A0A8T0EZG8_ARGBR|nr:Retrovirus-related Pol polyprotein like [Argiope bruennichi]
MFRIRTSENRSAVSKGFPGFNSPSSVKDSSSVLPGENSKMDLTRILPKFDLQDHDMALFLNLFELQLKFLKVPESTGVPNLVGSLPSDVGRIIACEPEEDYQDYQKIQPRYRYENCQSIIITSDHQPLKWLMSLQSPTGRLTRWALQIQLYNLTINYIPGRLNFIADLLSRPVCEHPSTGSCQICAVSVEMPTTSSKEFRQSQLEDDNLRKIIEAFEGTEKEVDYATWTIRDIDQNVTPVCHPQSNPDERKKRDLEPRLAILVGNNHQVWKDKLPFIKFVLNTARCDST